MTMKKILYFSRVLFLSCLMFLGSLGSVWAQTGNITLDAADLPVEQVLDEIEQQSRFLFLNEEVDLSRKITLHLKNQSIEKVLSVLFHDMDVHWEILGTNIYISKASSKQTSVLLSGTVTDGSGSPVMGCGVLVKGSSAGTVTDLDGNFSLELPESASELEFSCLGYRTIVVPVAGKKFLRVVLQEDNVLLEGTVVTALGIKRSEKALSYNVQKVDSEELLANKDANFVNSLNGKVAGLVINASSSGVGGASKVVMRGNKSVSKSSNALYVIDGVPMYTTARVAGTEFDSKGSTDPVADVNPEDIESMTVLTGASAAALYGSEAANGAIVITTKKGKEGKTVVTVTSNTEVFNPFILPRFQNTYGTGDDNSPEGSVIRSWGKKLNDSNFMGYEPKEYFQTGMTGTESVSISTGNDKNQTYLSAAAVNSRGNVPNNNYNRYNFTIRNTSRFFQDKVTLDLSANYVMQDDRNMTNQGIYNNPIVGAYLFPRGNDWKDISMYERWDNTRKIHTQYWPVGDAGITMQNPYWINYRNLRNNKKNRYMFNAGLSYEIADWISLSGRVRVDNSNNIYTERFYATTNTQLTEKSQNGLYGNTRSEDKQVYADFLLDINKTWDNWSLHANAGASITDMRSDLLEIKGPISDGIVDPSEAPNAPNIFNVFALSKSKTVKKQVGWREQTQSVYGSAEIGFMNTFYLTLTGRNDWPSQLAGPRSGSKSFFYPSAGLSIVLSNLFDAPENLEYLKVRASYASVGSAFQRFVANPLHTWPDKGASWETETSYPIENLKPEKTNSWEAGITMRFLKHFNLDATFYNTHTLNQTIYPKISTGSGYSEIPIQSGDILNRGLELSLGFDKTWNRFTWQSNYTFSTNRNRIEKLVDNAINPVTGEQLKISSLDMKGGGLGNVKFILKEGGSLGDIYSRQDLKRDSNNDIYVDHNGNISTQDIKKVEDYIRLGSVFPTANMAWRNDFRLGNFNFGFMLTARLGGVVYSRTQAMLDYYGVSEASALARDKGGVLINGSDLFDANRWLTTIGGGDTVPQYYTYSATNVRLQEAAVGYTIPRKAMKGVCELSFQLVGRNLWMIWNKAPFDPESIATTGNYYQGIDYFMMPNTRNFGFNVRLKF